MPVTKTAKRALRVAKRKLEVNKKLRSNLEIAVRMAKREKREKDILTAVSLADRAAKTNVIHKNKAARIKSTLAKISAKKTAKIIPPKKAKSKK